MFQVPRSGRVLDHVRRFKWAPTGLSIACGCPGTAPRGFTKRRAMMSNWKLRFAGASNGCFPRSLRIGGSDRSQKPLSRCGRNLCRARGPES